MKILLPLLLAPLLANAADVDCSGSHALRAAGHATREWSDFPERAEAKLECTLPIPAGGARTLVLRQDDVKRPDWEVSLNGHKLGRLLADEHRQMAVFEIPPQVASSTAARLSIATASPAALQDDIRVDRIAVHAPPPAAWLSQATLDVRVSNGIPVRLTITDDEGTLLSHGMTSGDGIAARTGVVYTASGKARIPVPAGRYTVWASRGFAYSAEKASVTATAGQVRTVQLRLRREVQIPGGWAAGDTHLHTRERSGHGDATVAERILSIAGEGLDWAVSSEHNLASTFVVSSNWFKAIPGVEVTTPKGHFNAFPWPLEKSVPDVRGDWPASLTPDMAVIWNHPRDIHSGYRPFDPAHYVADGGEGHNYPGNALEVVNSGAMYSHPLRLAEDWMHLLNRGRQFAAIGSSDSHTVATFAAGQARTYVKGSDVAAAIRRGDTAVSYGLAAFLERKPNGELVASVYGPSWSRAKALRVYSNGELISERKLEAKAPAAGGLQWQGVVAPPKLRRDAFLVVIATGDDNPPFWPISRPYQAVSPDWAPMTLGISPALRWDGDGDGKFETAREQAEAILKVTNSTEAIAAALRERDSAVTAQMALLLAGKPF